MPIFTCPNCGNQDPIEDYTLRYDCANCDNLGVNDPIHLFPQNIYQGPGIYQHYKGPCYVVFGLLRVEYNESRLVLYMTLDQGHREEAFYKGMIATGRPLNEEDGPDWWNKFVPAADGKGLVPRFQKVG